MGISSLSYSDKVNGEGVQNSALPGPNDVHRRLDCPSYIVVGGNIGEDGKFMKFNGTAVI